MLTLHGGRAGVNNKSQRPAGGGGAGQDAARLTAKQTRAMNYSRRGDKTRREEARPQTGAARRPAF